MCQWVCSACSLNWWRAQDKQVTCVCAKFSYHLLYRPAACIPCMVRRRAALHLDFWDVLRHQHITPLLASSILQQQEQQQHGKAGGSHQLQCHTCQWFEVAHTAQLLF